MMATATLARARILRSLVRPLAELTSKYSPSVLNHTGVTCGDPSPIVVARNKKAWVLSANRSWKSLGIFFMVAPFG